MTFRQAAALAPVCFFLGILFNCFNVDHRILWGEMTEDVKEDAFQFYLTFYSSPYAIKALLHGMIGVGIMALLMKLSKWNDSAFFFDGTSLGAYIFALSIYVTVTISNLEAIANPTPEEDNAFAKLEAIRVLSAGNVIIACCLGAILVLQAGQLYADSVEAKAKETALEKDKRSKTE